MQTGLRCGAGVCLALLLTLSLQACGGPPQQSKSVLRIPIYGVLHAPDPALAVSSGDRFLSSLLYSGLVKYSPDLHVIPELAVSIPTISSSGLTYTFTIRHDARFADGRHCTAWDIAYSLARALQIGGANARRALGGIAGAAEVESGEAKALYGVQVLHRLSLRIHLVEPDAEFLQKLALPVAAVVDRRVVPRRRVLRWPDIATGTGPWMLSSRAHDGSLFLIPRPHFYGSALQLRYLQLVPVADAATGLTLYRKDALDVGIVPQPDIRRVSGQADFHESDALTAYYAVPRAGDALPLAAKLDRDRMIQKSGLALSPLDTIVPSAVPDYVSSAPQLNAGSDPPSSSPAVSVRITGRADGTELILRKQLLQQWRSSSGTSEAQIPVKLRIVRASHLLPDPGFWIRLVLPQTRSRWLRDSLNTAQTLTNDPVDRMDIYDQCERWSLAKGFIIPLAAEFVGYLIRPSVQGVQVTPMGVMPQDNNWSSVSIT